jgi:hypothetical protein|tara:strand:+ start:369 stop:527 length:159 start_codon:yes stop_codon:yes gene_type:complete
MTQTGAYAPQKRYAEKQRALGMVPVTVWVPEEKREQTVEYAEKLRVTFKKVQ